MSKKKLPHERKKMGRPRIIEDFIPVMKILLLNGKTEQEIATLLKFDQSSLTKFKKKNPDFFTALKEWKAEADAKVERSLYERACGYSCTDTYFSNFQGQVTATPYTKNYPPDPTSMIFWLKNRQPDKWRDKQEVEHKGDFIINVTGIKRL